MATTAKKQFLDYAGLQTFWSIITGRFADKDKTITKQEIVEVDGNYGQGDDNFGKKTLQLVSTLADNTTTVATKLPLANRTTPGLMTPDHYTIVDDLHANIEKMAPFAGLQLANEIDETLVHRCLDLMLYAIIGKPLHCQRCCVSMSTVQR